MKRLQEKSLRRLLKGIRSVSWDLSYEKHREQRIKLRVYILQLFILILLDAVLTSILNNDILLPYYGNNLQN